MIKSFSNTEFYKTVKLSFKLDYLTPLVIDNQARKLSTLLNINVVYNRNIKVQDNQNGKYLRIYPNNKELGNILTIETYPEPYFEGINTLTKIVGLINEKGYTNDNCSLEIKIYINSEHLKGYSPIRAINKLKFVLGLDENVFFKYWKKGNKYINRQMVHFVVPKKMFFNFDMRYISPNDFDVPASKYFGLDFSTVSKGYFTVNYVGGKDYEKNINNIVDGITYLLDRSEEVLKNPNSYNSTELIVLKDSLNKHKDKIISLIKYDNFIKKFPGIKLFVDLKDEPNKVNLHYDKFRELLFKLIIHGNLKRGLINLDTSSEKFQMKDTNIFYIINIKDLEIYDSIISGDFVNCYFDNCQIRSSKILNSTINNKCKINNSDIYKTNVLEQTNIFTECYIYKCSPLRGDFRESVIDQSPLSYDSIIDTNTIIND